MTSTSPKITLDSSRMSAETIAFKTKSPLIEPPDPESSVPRIYPRLSLAAPFARPYDVAVVKLIGNPW
jgi:hypothetical protein